MQKIAIIIFYFFSLHSLNASHRLSVYKIKDHYQILTCAIDNNIGFGLQYPSVIHECIPSAGNEYSQSEIDTICNRVINTYVRKNKHLGSNQVKILKTLAFANKSKMIETIAVAIVTMDIV